MPPKKKTPVAAAKRKPVARANVSRTASRTSTSSAKKASPSTSRKASPTRTSSKAPVKKPAPKKKPATSPSSRATSAGRASKKAPAAAAKKNARTTSKASTASKTARAKPPPASRTKAAVKVTATARKTKKPPKAAAASRKRARSVSSSDSSSDSAASSGWEDVPSSLFSQAARANTRSLASASTLMSKSTSKMPTHMDDNTVSASAAPPKKNRVEHAVANNNNKEEEEVVTAPCTPTRATAHPREHRAFLGEDDAADKSNVPSPVSLTADSEGRRSTTAFRQSLFQQQQQHDQQQEQGRRSSHGDENDDDDEVTVACVDTETPPRAPHAVSGPGVVKELFQRQPRGISCDVHTPVHVVDAVVASTDVAEDEQEEEVLIPSDASVHEDEDDESPAMRGSYFMPPPPADTATPPPSSLTLPTHQLPMAEAGRTSPHRTSLSFAGAIRPTEGRSRHTSSSPPSSHSSARVALDVDADQEVVVLVKTGLDGSRGSQRLSGDGDNSNRGPSLATAPQPSMPPASSSSAMAALSAYTLSRDPTNLLDHAHAHAFSQPLRSGPGDLSHTHNYNNSTSLPLSPSPQAPRASQGHLRLGSISRPRSPAAVSNGAPASAFLTPPRRSSLPRPTGHVELEEGRAVEGRSPATLPVSRWGTSARADAPPSALFPRDPPIWRSPQPALLRPSAQASALNSRKVSPFSLSHAPAPGTTGIPTMPHAATPAARMAPAPGTSHGVSGGLESHRDTPSRPSAQLVTRAAATRPTAAPTTMWICIDEDDDDDLEIPTSPTSPTLRHVVIAPREADGAAKRATSPKLSVPVALTGGRGGGELHVKSELSGVGGASAEEEQRAFLQQAHQDRVAQLAAEAARRADRQSQQTQQTQSQKVTNEAKSESIAPLSSAPNKEDDQAGSTAVDATASASATSSLAIAVSGRPLREPIADVLSPTFRPRRGVIPLHRAPTQRLSPLPSGCYIRMDDDDEDDEDDEEKETKNEDRTSRSRVPRAASGSHAHSVRSSPPKDGAHLVVQSPSPVRLSATLAAHTDSMPSLIAHDDSDSDKDDKDGKNDEMVHKQNTRASDEEGGEMTDVQTAQGAHTPRAEAAPATPVDEEAEPATPLRSIKQLLFPARHAHGSGHSSSGEALAAGTTTNAHGAADGLLFRPTAAEASAGGQKKKAAATGRVDDTYRAEDAETVGWGRPVDVLERDFFASKLTKKSFMTAARKAISDEHFLEPNEFWSAFSSAEFVGEGSFGLVWRCQSVEGDLVAVKSCPISLASRANIDDSFSTVREVATMRFLSEMQVPYVLPMHSAFFASATEALPPSAMEALQWRRAQVKKAEAAALEKQVQLLSKGKKKPAARRGKRTTTTTTAADDDTPAEEAEPVLTLEEETQRQLQRLREAESGEEAAERRRLEAVKLPRFLSITEEDVLEGEATIFLVLELCDGDLEGIRRTDGLTKGVAFCVSSALAAMHELGLLHLDLKPSNILYAYEYGPSQQPQVPLPPASALASAPHMPGGTAAASVKFYLSDFGNCRVVGPNPYDAVDDAFGTFEYMDLAALENKVCRRATDTFSLGATLYELLFGRRVYPKCQDPKCVGDEDHTRHCFVAAAKQPIVLPIGDRAEASGGGLLTADRLAASVGLAGKSGLHKAGKRRGGSGDGGDDVERSPFSVGSTTSTTKVALTVLQKLTAALLQHNARQRMTAEQCRSCLIAAYNITQEDVTVEGSAPQPLAAPDEEHGTS